MPRSKPHPPFPGCFPPPPFPAHSGLLVGAAGIARVIGAVLQPGLVGAVKIPVSKTLHDGEPLDGVLRPRLVEQSLAVDVTGIQEIPVCRGAGDDRLDLLLEGGLVSLQVGHPAGRAVRGEAGLPVAAVQDSFVVLGVGNEDGSLDEVVDELRSERYRSIKNFSGHKAISCNDVCLPC